MAFVNLLLKFLRCERGNVESALVLLPLMSLFLIATQINVAIHSRNMEKVVVQDQASKKALTGDFEESDQFLPIYSPDPHQNLDLVVTTRESNVPRILGDEYQVKVTGIAIVENQR
jgi:hypothetical protein